MTGGNAMKKKPWKNFRGKAAAVCIAAVLAVCTGVPAAAAQTSASAGPYHVILSITGDASASRTVTWHDQKNVSAGTVIYSQDEEALSASHSGGGLSGTASVQGAKTVISSGIDTQSSVFSAQLTGLSAGTTYYYYVKSSTGNSGILSFTTAERDQQTLSFAYLGDIQFENDMQKEYEEWNQLISGIYKKNPDLTFGMIGGDLVQSGIRMAEWNAFLDNATDVFSRIPLMTVNGNHESNLPSGKPELYLDLFTLPENGPEGFKEEFYSFDYGSCHITALNSWIFSGEQSVSQADYDRIEQWIENDISGSDAKWKFVIMHHPVYALASDNVSAKVKENWAPIFEKCGVDIVFCGHQHVYSRSYPLTEGRIDAESGVTYVMGNSGQKFYSSADETLQEKTVYSTSTCQVVRIDGDTLELMTYDREGNELDYFSLNARRQTADTGELRQQVLQNLKKLCASVGEAVKNAA